MFSRSIRIAAAIVFIVSAGPAITQQSSRAAEKLPNVKTAFVDFTRDQLVVGSVRLCTTPNKVEAVFLGGDPLTVISSKKGLMILAFERSDIEFGVSHLLSIRCTGGAKKSSLRSISRGQASRARRVPRGDAGHRGHRDPRDRRRAPRDRQVLRGHRGLRALRVRRVPRVQPAPTAPAAHSGSRSTRLRKRCRNPSPQKPPTRRWSTA